MFLSKLFEEVLKRYPDVRFLQMTQLHFSFLDLMRAKVKMERLLEYGRCPIDAIVYPL